MSFNGKKRSDVKQSGAGGSIGRPWKLLRLVSAALLLAAMLAGGGYLYDAFREAPPIRPLPSVAANDSTFVFLSDTQSPLWPETFVLRANRNEDARAMIFDAICDAGPGAVFHGGDLVALGFNQRHWEPIDQFTGRLAQAGIPFFPVPGNHEYMIFRDTGIGNFRVRFPGASLTGYVEHVGPMAFVLLNSNLGAMSLEMARHQESWYARVMDSLDAQSAVNGITVICHHSPFTNSSIVDPSEDSQERFVPKFLGSSKGMLFLSGHAHAFEHFELYGKTFLVAGGGGGLQQPLLTETSARWPDSYTKPGSTRMFHYVSGLLTATGVTVDIRMIMRDFSGFETVSSLFLPWPSRGGLE